MHLVADSGPMALDRVGGYSDEEIESVVTEALRRHLVAGVTMVRDLGDRNFNVVDRRSRHPAGTAGTWAGKPPGPTTCTPRSGSGSNDGSTWSR